MALYKRKRGKTWWTSFTAPNGQRIRRSTRTQSKEAAQEYEDRLKAELWRQCQLKERPRRRWQEAVVKWLRENNHKRTHEKDKALLKWLDPHLRGKYLDEVDRDVIESIAQMKEADGAKPATVNRHLAVIKSILRAAWQEWDWTDKVPKIRMRKETNKRMRFLTRAEAETLFRALPDHLEPLARFAVSTGLRATNITRLKWAQVDLQQQLAWVQEADSKSGYALGVALNAEARKVLRQQIGKHTTYVFTYKDAPIKRIWSYSWRNACRRVGIEDLRFHDLRHTWASWHAQAGTPLSVLQELGGWRSTAMVQRYAHLTVRNLIEYAEKIVPDTNLAQTPIKAVDVNG